MRRATAVAYPNSLRIVTMLAVVMVFAGGAYRAETGYDPLALPKDFKAETVDLTVQDAARGRDILLHVYLPSDRAPAPVVLFSHGLGGSREGSAYLGRHWAARGHVVVFTQHPGSAVSGWQGKPAVERMAAMRQAANPQKFMLRVGDIHVVLHQLARWRADTASPLHGRVDPGRIGMSGHSFGALTTQAVSGQHFPLGDAATDSRIKAAVLFRPSSPRRGDPKAEVSSPAQASGSGDGHGG